MHWKSSIVEVCPACKLRITNRSIIMLQSRSSQSAQPWLPGGSTSKRRNLRTRRLRTRPPNAHSYQLLCCRWMDRHTWIQVCLCASHLHCHTKALHIPKLSRSKSSEFLQLPASHVFILFGDQHNSPASFHQHPYRAHAYPPPSHQHRHIWASLEFLAYLPAWHRKCRRIDCWIWICKFLNCPRHTYQWP